MRSSGIMIKIITKKNIWCLGKLDEFEIGLPKRVPLVFMGIGTAGGNGDKIKGFI